MSHPAEVTIILATYNRPDTLRVAMQSVLLQSHPHWKLLVVGDHCDDRTRAVVEHFADPRIRYVNLPVRAGEQAGPNSVGIALCDTEYLAFLNHDDLWLKDHLAYGLTLLGESGAGFFAGKSVFVDQVEERAAGVWTPRFGFVHGDRRHPRQSVAPISRAQQRAFEPTSAWILQTAAAKAVGSWRGRGQLFGVSPIRDWVRRAWRQDVSFVFGEQLSVLKMNLHNSGRRRLHTRFYDCPSPEHEHMYRLLERTSADEMRRLILLHRNRQSEETWPKKVEHVSTSAGRWKHKPVSSAWRHLSISTSIAFSALFGPIIAKLYYRFGVEVRGLGPRILHRMLGRRAEDRLNIVTQRRTGDRIEKWHDIDEIVALTVASL